MERQPTFLAIIPARCGSKGLPGKNILPLIGKPLIAWSINASLKSKFVTSTIVSSDCDEILNVAKEFGATPLKRPKELAQDSSPSEPLISHAIEHFEREGEFFDYLILLQPTSPLRDASDIDSAIKKLLANNADALISVYEPSHSPFKAFTTNSEGYLQGIVDNETPFMRRQDLPSVYLTNGAIYIIKTEEFKKTRRLFASKTLPYIMPKEKSVDIDTPDDLKSAEEYLKRHIGEQK